MTNASKQLFYEFEDFRLDAAKSMLYRRGEEIFLPRKTIETLVVLVENRGEIVGKDELMNRIWEDSIVEESNLSQYIYQLRKTLGSQADGKPFIETFRRRGYRFNGAVSVEKNSSPSVSVAPPEVAQISTSSGYDVERRGNVLKLIEWKGTENQPSEAVPESAPTVTSSSRKSFVAKATIAAAFATLVLISTYFYFQRSITSNVETRASAKNELTFVRLTNGSAPAGATVSADGKYFVYHEQDGAVAHLWLQQIGQSNRLEIIPPSKKMIFGKSFSPDGRFVYYVAHDGTNAPNELFRVPALGGVPVKILEDISSPPSFSPDGRQIVFQRYHAETQESFLTIADAAGGNEKTLLARTKERGVLGMPSWSPDGTLVAFSELSPVDGSAINDVNSFTISSISLQTGEMRALSPEKWTNCYRIVWTRDGRGLVFVGTKAGDVNSTRRDQIYYFSIETGEARRLTTDGNRHQLDSLGVTDADEILVVPFNRSSQIWLMESSGDARTAVQITSGLADGRAGLVALADGRIAYVARIGENVSVWTAGADGTEPRQITYDPPFAEEVRAAPDGSFLIFNGEKEDGHHLYRVDADGANLRQLTFGGTNDGDSTVSPDGDWVFYNSEIATADGVKSSLKKIPSAGGEPVLLADMSCAAPHLSPDGKFISCVEDAKFFIISAEDGSVLKTFEPVQVPYFNPGARWSPDGRALVYIARRKNFSNLWRQPVDGGKPEPLTNFTSGELHNFAFTPDGSRLYLARGFEVRDVMLIKNFR